jgi:hypothetical protein
MKETHSNMQWWSPSWASLNNANGVLSIVHGLVLLGLGSTESPRGRRYCNEGSRRHERVLLHSSTMPPGVELLATRSPNSCGRLRALLVGDPGVKNRR